MLVTKTNRSLIHKKQATPPAEIVPTQQEWEEMTRPQPHDRVRIGEDTPPEQRDFHSMSEARLALGEVSYHEGIDPFVATVAGGIYARKADSPKGADDIRLYLPKYYKKDFEVEVGLQHGPDAPMLVILPGIFGSRDGGFNTLVKKSAHERGMNYMVIPNALGDDALDDAPLFHPGNPRLEAEMVLDILRELKAQKPDFFDRVSISGYSYGALLAANVVRADEESPDERLVNGGMFAISPPENLYDSMRELDGLREQYAQGADSIISTTLKYRRETRKYGYDRFPESEVAQRGEGTNITEIKMSDLYGSRNDMKDMVDRIDEMFEHDLLPPVPWEPWKENERKKILENMTYVQYSGDWFAKDRWLQERHLTPQQMATDYSFSQAIKNIRDTPILSLSSADDYIVNDRNVEAFRQLEAEEEPLEEMKVLDTGGHVGVLFNPRVRGLLVDFTYSTAAHPEKFEQ